MGPARGPDIAGRAAKLKLFQGKRGGAYSIWCPPAPWSMWRKMKGNRRRGDGEKN